MKIDTGNEIVSVDRISLGDVVYNIHTRQAYINVSLINNELGAYNYRIPFRYDGDWTDDEVKVFALNYIEDADLEKTTDITIDKSNSNLPNDFDVSSSKSWWEYLLFWRN